MKYSNFDSFDSQSICRLELDRPFTSSVAADDVLGLPLHPRLSLVHPLELGLLLVHLVVVLRVVEGNGS